uniref:RING-type domain-containing protein n=1 Tax=Hyaloperonospora arabidopsidis (strain Emoy2) TaxID=559515 RepID=M4BPZ0_HYAAE
MSTTASSPSSHSVLRVATTVSTRAPPARHLSPRAVHHSSRAFADAVSAELTAACSPHRRVLIGQKATRNALISASNGRAEQLVDHDDEEGKTAETDDNGQVDTLFHRPDGQTDGPNGRTGDGTVPTEAVDFLDVAGKRTYETVLNETVIPVSKELDDGKTTDELLEDGEGCLICMDEFSARRKAYPLPCTGQCTGAYVHYRCIMAWLGQSGSCPLCRGACDPLVLQPMQKLELQDMTKMALQPVPLDAGIIRCYVKQVYRGLFKQYGYELYLQGQIGTQEEDKFLLAARRQVRSNMTANYTICTDKECTDAERIGRMGSNFLGTCFTLYDNGRDPQKLAKIQDAVSSDDVVVQNVLQIREELGCVTYEPNRTSVGPRKMRVVVPDVDEEGGSSKIVRPMSRQDRLVTRLSTGDMKDLMRFSNREPVFREDLGAYCLDFGGRVSMASVKNFQLISSEDPSMGNILQFGRVADDMFTMDFQWPLSPFQAFSICLSSCDTKLACV